MKARVVVLAATAFPAMAAADVPRFDVEAHCEAIAGFSGSYSSEMYNYCIESEQAAYDALKPRWNAVPATAQHHCEKIASFSGPGSYEMLKYCIDEETSAEANKRSFSF